MIFGNRNSSVTHGAAPANKVLDQKFSHIDFTLKNITFYYVILFGIGKMLKSFVKYGVSVSCDMKQRNLIQSNKLYVTQGAQGSSP